MERESNIEKLLEGYLKGELDPAGDSAVEGWLESDADNRSLAAGVCMSSLLSESLRIENEGGHIQALGRARAAIRRTRLRRILKFYRSGAAVLALPLIVISVYLFSSVRGMGNSDIEIRSGTGMVSSLVLPDSTRVWLNSNSKLTYPVRFSGRERHVALSGEGFFEVAPDRRKPFVVASGPVEVRVLGTKFNMEAYEDASDIRTTLVEGKVVLTYDNNGTVSGKSLVLEPGQMVTYDRGAGQVWTRTVDTAVGTSWKDGRIVLREIPLEQALRMVGNKYNVTFVITDQSLRENTFVGVFSGNTLDAVLRNFTLSSDIHFRKVKGAAENDYSGREIIEVY